MPSRNSSDRPKGRRPSSPGSNSAGKSFGKKAAPRKFDKPFDKDKSKPSGFSRSKSSSGPDAGTGRGDKGKDFSKPSGRGKGFGGPPRDSDDRRPSGFKSSSTGKPGTRSFGARDERPGGPRTRKGDDRPRGQSSSADRKGPAGDDRRGSFSKPPDRNKGFSSKPPRAGKEGDSSTRRPYRGKAEGKSFGDRDRRADSKGDASERRPFQDRENKKFERTGVSRSGKSIHRDKEQGGPPNLNGPIRLNRFIANSGVCSRREADELITMGLISINGKVVTTLGSKVNPGDEVRHESKILRAEKPIYLLLNKPKGYLTTTADPQERSTVMNLVGNVVKERIYPVGRLDRNTTGLLLLTNDGDLADKLMHPSYNIKKIYRVELDRPLTKADSTRILEGVQLEEGKAIVDELAIVSDDGKTVGLEIHIGWNRVVRRIFESLEYQVTKLDRTVYAGLTKKDLGRGEWRFLTKEELVLLKHFKS